MRHPLRKAALSLTLTIIGVSLVLLVTDHYQQLGKTFGTILGVTGLFMAIIPCFIFFWTLLAAIGYARLLAGKGVIARWHLSPVEWDRFRVFDSARALQHLDLRNDLRVRKITPASGVDVIVGRRQLIIDGSYHPLRRFGVPELRGINWIGAPTDPECLEFFLSYPRGRFGGTLRLTLRVPVPAHARSDGVRVYEHYQALGPQPRR